jgi:hypothetical protein
MDKMIFVQFEWGSFPAQQCELKISEAKDA